MNRVREAIFIITLLVFAGITGFAQSVPQNNLFYNNAQVYIDSGVAVQIYGNTLTTGPLSILKNDGEIYVHFDSIYATATKGFMIDNFAVVSGTGYFEIEPDWTNNSPSFIPSNNRVHLMSDVEQLITGTNPTDFFQLELSGKGTGIDKKKRMTIDARVLDSLSLNNRELATDSFKMNIQNTDPNAISFSTVTNDRGFVSSLKGDQMQGSLQRRTANAQTAYIFPVGSSLNPPSGQPYIYRPVDLLPTEDNINLYGVRFVNETPDIEGYDQFSIDDSICTVNPNFYHFVNHPSGSAPARIRVYYDHLQDGRYDHLAQWGTGQWNLIKESQYNPSTPQYRVGVSDWGFFSRDSLPLILADRIPAVASIFGSPDVCANGEKLYTANGNTIFYTWETENGIEILSGQGTDSVMIKVGENSGYLIMTPSSSTNKCAAPPDSLFIVVHPGPVANFRIDKIQALTRQKIEFRDSTIGSPIDWYWEFDDGTTASSPIVKHQFMEVGEYQVKMIVKDENGCLDSIFKSVEIIEGITVPNVFTPNGDGHNDFFYIPNSGVKEYNFQVFNRWGLLIFETTAPEIAWDGFNSSGNPTPEGTYYYVLEAKSLKNDYSFKGYLTLLR